MDMGSIFRSLLIAGPYGEEPLINKQKIIEASTDIIHAIGEDPTREGLLDTPKRIAKMYEEFFSGLGQNPNDVLDTSFNEGFQEVVLVKDIPFFSICEHHFLPMFGSAHVAYIPNGRVLGASKFARALDILAKRPQIQERLCSQFVEAIHNAVGPDGTAVTLDAEHMCMALRGIKKPGSRIVTFSSRGEFSKGVASKNELIDLLRQN